MLRNIFRYTFCLLILSTSYLSLGTTYLKKETVSLPTVAIDYTFKDSFSYNKKDEITETIVQAFAIFTSIFGGPPRDLSDKTYRRIRVEIKEGQNGGEADPGVIFLTLSNEKLFGFSSWKTILLHELFHLWNAESIRYKDGREHWFNEGFSEYYAFRTATKIGILTPQEALEISLFPIGYYSSAKGLGKISMRDAGRNNKSKFDHYFLVYHGGWVTAIILDFDIRKRTQNRKNLDSLMAWLYKNFPRSKKLYDMEDIIRGLKVTTGKDYSEFFKSYINGTQTIPIANYFNVGKAMWSTSFGQKIGERETILFKTLGFLEY